MPAYRAQSPRVIRRNVRIRGRRTTIKLETGMWDALDEISTETGRSFEAICDEIAKTRDVTENFTSELRLFILDYYRDAVAHHA